MNRQNLNLKKLLPYILIIGGIIGVLCAFALSQDKIKLIENPNAHLNCSLNPIIACGGVVQSDQGHAFGFPNPFLGLVGFAVLATAGVALLAANKFKRWFWLGLEAGLLFAVGFIYWLIFESVYRINALCLFCMTIWVVTITCFWYVSLYNVDQKHIRLPKGRAQRVYAWVRRHHLDILILWLLVIAALILKHFWYYYGKNF